MRATVTNKTVRLLLYLGADASEPSHISDVAAYIYNRLDLAVVGGPTLESLAAGLGGQVSQAKGLLRAARKAGWDISRKKQGYVLDPEQYRLMRKVQQMYEAGIYWVNRVPLTPGSVARWIISNARLDNL